MLLIITKICRLKESILSISQFVLSMYDKVELIL